MDKQVSLKKVLAVVGVLVVLGGTFYAGMAFENHRIASGVQDAFDDLDDEDFTYEDDTTAEAAPDPVELRAGAPLAVVTSDYGGNTGELSVTLLKSEITDHSNNVEGDPTLTRGLLYTLRVENTGDLPMESGLSGHYESDSGQVFDFAGVMCDDEMPTDELAPGQFAEGCGFSDIPADAGRFVFEADTPFYIKVPAA